MPNQNHASLKEPPKGPFWEAVVFLKTHKLLRNKHNAHDFIKEHIYVNLS